MSKKKNGLAPLTLFAEASRASHSAQQESEEEKQMTATSGRRCYELSERLNQPGLLAKTLLASSRWTAGLYSNKYALRWKMKGTPLNRLYFQLYLLERRTDGTEFGLLLTPGVVQVEETSESYRARMDKAGHKNGNQYNTLASQIMGLLPTPTMRDYKSEKASQKTMERNARPLSETLGHNTGMKLQPAFAEFLMGYPENWTRID